MSICVSVLHILCAIIILNRYTDAQFGGMGYYPYAYAVASSYIGGGLLGSGGYYVPCYYQPYPIFGASGYGEGLGYGGSGYGGEGGYGDGGYGGGGYAGGLYGGAGGYGGINSNFGAGIPYYGSIMRSASSGLGFATSIASSNNFFG